MRTWIRCRKNICSCRPGTFGPSLSGHLQGHPMGKDREKNYGWRSPRILNFSGTEGNTLCILWRASWGRACWREDVLYSESDGHDLTWFMDLSLLFDALSNMFWEVHLMSLFNSQKLVLIMQIWDKYRDSCFHFLQWSWCTERPGTCWPPGRWGRRNGGSRCYQGKIARGLIHIEVHAIILFFPLLSIFLLLFIILTLTQALTPTSLIRLILVNHQALCWTLHKVLAFPYPAHSSNPAPASTVDKTVFLCAVKNFAHFYLSKKNFKVSLSNRVEKSSSCDISWLWICWDSEMMVNFYRQCDK